MPQPKQHLPDPLIPEAVVAYLERVFPDRCPDPAVGERELWMAAGAVSVVRKLPAMAVQQSERRLSTQDFIQA